MTGRTAAGAPLLLWPFPDLETAAAPVSAPTSGDPDNGAGADVEPARGAAPEGSGEARASGDDERSVREIVEEQIAKGYADGLERGLAEGKDQGYAAGFEAGTKAAEEALAAQAHQLAAVIAYISAPIAALEKPVEEAVAALALEVARCVIGSETSRSREYLVRLIREAIDKVPIEMRALRIVLNPADLELVRGLAPEIEDDGAALVGDPAIEAGGCLVVADGQGMPVKDMRWQPRAGEGMSQVDLTLASRWRGVMLALFEGEEK